MPRIQLSHQAIASSLFIRSKMCKNKENKKWKLTIFEMTLFAMFGSLMFISKIMMEFLPNFHLLGVFTILLTVVYRKKALVPIYIYVFLNGVYSGFNMWWVPYLYIWTILWAATMLLPKNMSKKSQIIAYPLLCALHGILFGVLYAPAQAVMFHFTLEQTVAWIVAGLPFDLVHSVGNLALGFLIYPLSELLKKLNRKVAKL